MKVLLLTVTMLSSLYAIYGINGGTTVNNTDLNYVVKINASITVKYKNECSQPTLSLEFFRICTGGIIQEKFILSVAHCFVVESKKNINKNGYHQRFVANKVKVYAYAANICKVSNTRVITREAEKVHFLQIFLETGEHDIAIVELKDGLDLSADSQYVLKKLTLPQPAEAQDHKVGKYKSYENATCFIAGFGVDKRSGQNDGGLKQMYSKIFSETWYQNSKQTVLIATAIDKDGNRPTYPLGICDGDSGAPVVLLESPLVIIGVVQAFNRKFTINHGECDSREKKHPDIFARITNYLDFIHHVTSSKPDNPKFTSHSIS